MAQIYQPMVGVVVMLLEGREKWIRLMIVGIPITLLTIMNCMADGQNNGDWDGSLIHFF